MSTLFTATAATAATVEQVRYRNIELDIVSDGSYLALLIALVGIVTLLVQRLILRPMACRVFPSPQAKKRPSSPPSLPSAATTRIDGRVRIRTSDKNSPNSNPTAATEPTTINNTLSIEEKIEAERWKFVTAGTKMISYLVFLAIGCWALRDQTYWLWDPSTHHLPFEPAPIPRGLKVFYAVETAHYAFTMVSMFWEPRMKDRAQMLLHHCFTLLLLTTSYCLGTVRYGTIIMLLHDFSDPWMEAAKMCNYAELTWAANLLFLVFAISFVVLRVFVFPRWVIWSTWQWARPAGYPTYWLTFVCLGGLWCLHVFWSYLIGKVMYVNVVLGERKGDVREE